jgi:hypothetical protein
METGNKYNLFCRWFSTEAVITPVLLKWENNIRMTLKEIDFKDVK